MSRRASKCPPDQAIQLYLVEGLSLDAVATRLGCSHTQVRRVLLDTGIALRPPGRPSATGVDIEKAVSLYAQGLSLRAVAWELSHGYAETRNVLIEAGVTIRSRGGARPAWRKRETMAPRPIRKEIAKAPVKTGTRGMAWEHGTVVGYRHHHCRCILCREASSRSSRESRARSRAAGLMPDSAHGTEGGYVNWKCRCRPCRVAKTEAGRRRYLRSILPDGAQPHVPAGQGPDVP